MKTRLQGVVADLNTVGELETTRRPFDNLCYRRGSQCVRIPVGGVVKVSRWEESSWEERRARILAEICSDPTPADRCLRRLAANQIRAGPSVLPPEPLDQFLKG